MRIILRILGFVVCLILFFGLLLTGNIFFNLTGGILITLLAFIFLVIVIVHSIQSLVYQRENRSTKIMAIVFAVVAIPVLLIPLIFNILMQTQYSLVTGSEATPSYKMAFLSFNAVGKAIAFEEKYEMQEVDGIEMYYPSHEKEQQKLLDTTMDAIIENETLFNDYFSKQSNEGLRIKISGLLLKETHIEGGYYRPGEKQIYLQIPTKQDGWQFLYDTMVHEYTHYQFHMAVLGKGGAIEYYPSWFMEGIATHLQFIDRDSKEDMEEFEKKKWLPFDEIAFNTHWDEKRLDEQYNPYFQSRMFIDKLVDQQGPEVIMEIVTLTSQLGSFDQAFVTAVGKTADEFGNEVIKDIEQMKRTINK